MTGWLAYFDRRSTNNLGGTETVLVHFALIQKGLDLVSSRGLLLTLNHRLELKLPLGRLAWLARR
jgi:hypothetical protein